MATTGQAISATVTVAGRIAADPLAEVDLAIDAGGDLLTIDGAGDDLIVSAAVTWAGATASEAV
jgi:hypothetical protein